MNSSKKTSDGEFQVIWDQLTFQVETRPWYRNPKFDIFNKSKLDAINSTKKNVLNNISGSIKSGQLTGILGPSGAGKTSLLHCLFQNMTTGVTGNIVCKSDHDNEMKICYIPQKDYLIEHLTVREDLIFVSKLRAVTNAKGTNLVGERNSSESNKRRANDNADITQPFVDCISTITDEHNDEHNVKKNNNEVVDHDKIVENIADLLGLTSCLDVKISKISGGQSKRVSIAREIMAKPDILILDEPTTGLDSLTCYKTIQLLKSIADNTLIGSSDTKRMAIVVVIHQPQIEVFNIFDKTYFISKQGNVIYDDNPNKVSRILDLAANTKLPSVNYNTASYLIEVASGEYGQDIIDKLSLYYKNKFEKEFDVEKIIDEMEFKPHQRNMTLSKISKDYINSNDTINSQQIPAKKRRKSSSISIDLTKINPDIVVAVNRNIRLKELEMRENNSNQSIDNYTLRRESAASNDIVSPVVSGIKKKHYYISPQLEDCLSGHSISMRQSFSHLFILTQRAWLSTLRNPSLTKSRIIFHIISPLLVSLIYGTYIGHANACPNVSEDIDIQDIKNDINDGVIAQLQNDARSTYENMGFFFILMFSFTVNVLTVTSSIYPLSMQMFRKEVINGLYKSTPYLIAQTLAEIPLEIFLPTLSVCIAYWFTDQPGSFLAWRMLTVSLVMVVTCYTFHSIGLLFGSLFINNVNAAMLMAQAVSLPLSILCGFLARPSKMDEYTRMISYISPYKHGLEAALVARYGFGMCPCDKETNFTRLGTINGITPQVEHVLDYLFPRNSSDPNENGEVHPNEIFSKLGKRFAQSQTYGFEMNSCQDVKPFIMHTHQLYDETLYYRLTALLAIIVVLKAITFYLVNSVPQRMQAL